MQARLICLVVAAYFLPSVSSRQTSLEQIAFASNKLAFEIYRLLDPNSKTVWSPANLFITLAMLYEGARSSNAEQIHRVLYYHDAHITREDLGEWIKALLSLLNVVNRNCKLKFANAVVIENRRPVIEEYKEYLDRIFSAVFIQKQIIDYEVRRNTLRDVNSLVSPDLICNPEIFSKYIDANTELILFGFAYFKGEWAQIGPRGKQRGVFFNNGSDEIFIETVEVRGRLLHSTLPNVDFNVIEIPYKGINMTMVIFLPFRRYSLSEIEHHLDIQLIESYVCKRYLYFVDVTLPVFTPRQECSMKSVLQQIKLTKPFGYEAHLSGITEYGDLRLTDVRQTAIVEMKDMFPNFRLNDHDWKLINGSSHLHTFKVDRPFFYYIQDKRTGMILFMGRVNEMQSYHDAPKQRESTQCHPKSGFLHPIDEIAMESDIK